MMTKLTQVAAIVSMLFVGIIAAYDSPAQASTGVGDGVLEILGKRLCTANAPAEARCDWRLPDLWSPPRDDKPRPFTLLGKRYCPAFAEEPCDYYLGVDVDEAPEAGRVYSILGLDICVGDASTGCDVQVPSMPSDDRRASL